ncbi:MarC family protein [Oxynema sp. CENA135]|uniref:MarC family protein n=1 Tax=Oxynema sp. CENA135 TaxID=984206 RepID=UPI0019094358|nr:MarC family protein [Oxynema sp. CENA135]
MPENFVNSIELLLLLLNPFLMSIYPIDLIEQFNFKKFIRVLVRGASISTCVFIVFAWLGDAIFSDLLHVRFASFLIFGGVIFGIVGIRFVFSGTAALQSLRGNPEHIAGSIAMPFMIGPGTVSASVLAGTKLTPIWASIAIATALSLTVISVALLKSLHDFVKERNQALVERYIEVVGRVTALIIGTFAVEMILQGIDLWLGKAPVPFS